MRTDAIGSGSRASIGGGERDADAVIIERVFRAKLKQVRVAHLRDELQPEHDALSVALLDRPAVPARQAVDRVACGGLGEGKLADVAAELIATVADAVGPRAEQLAAGTGAHRVALIERNTSEVMGRSDLLELLATPTPIRHYIGFEISGKVHLGTGLVSMGKVRDFLAAGIDCHVLLADWHTWINDKLGGDREVIRRIATGYFTEAMRASLLALGTDPSRVHFVLGTDLYDSHPDYWTTVIEVSRNTTLARMLRSISILGREQSDSVDFAKLIYPAMQAADIFAQGINLAHAGTEQRKAHVIARDVATKIRTNRLTDFEGRTVKPAAVHHPLLLGLRRPRSSGWCTAAGLTVRPSKSVRRLVRIFVATSRAMTCALRCSVPA